MNELAEKILQEIQTSGKYTYSTNLVEKSHEIKAVDYLRDYGLIIIKARALGFVIAEAVY